MEISWCKYNSSHIRTDLALERTEGKEITDGIRYNEEYNDEIGVKLTTLEIINEKGEKSLGRAKGTYYTFETMPLVENDGSFHEALSVLVARYIRKLIDKNANRLKPYHILVAGLGNRQATADALGPFVIDNLYICDEEYEREKNECNHYAYLKAIAPGVKAQTGMETAKILRGIIDNNQVDILIVIDALAARSTKRLANTIQICDTGIMPGSGVGNNRNAINRQNMGVPVIAIGVPTVVDAVTIVGDSIENFFVALESENSAFHHAFMEFDYVHRQQFLREIIDENIAKMYVTPKDIDEMIKRVSYTLSEAINMCVTNNC